MALDIDEQVPDVPLPDGRIEEVIEDILFQMMVEFLQLTYVKMRGNGFSREDSKKVFDLMVEVMYDEEYEDATH